MVVDSSGDHVVGSRADAIDTLARALHRSMEKRDPSLSAEIETWESIGSRERDFYRGCVTDILYEEAAIRFCLNDVINNDPVYWHC